MDYIDWCLQAYVTIITPITYSQGFHQIISTFLYTVLTFESIDAFIIFIQNAVTYNAQNFIQEAYKVVFVQVLNNWISQMYLFIDDPANNLSWLSWYNTIVYQWWVFTYYLARSSLAAYTKQLITFYPQYKFPCKYTETADIDAYCKL